jgi:hypothetical protein
LIIQTLKVMRIVFVNLSVEVASGRGEITRVSVYAKSL